MLPRGTPPCLQTAERCLNKGPTVCHTAPRQRRAHAAAGGPHGNSNSGGSSGGGEKGPPASFLQNPAIAQREALRQFGMASSCQEQLHVVAQQAAVLDVGTRCGALLGGTASSNIVPLVGQSLQMLCHTADMAHKGTLPGDVQQQGELVWALYRTLEGSLPALQPLQLATVLWSIARVGIAGDWTDTLLQRAAEQELSLDRLASYNTKELSSLVYAYGRLTRQRSPEAQRYTTGLIGELDQRWNSLPYVKSNFSSTDFADLAEACARLYAAPAGTAAAATSDSGSSSDGSNGSSRSPAAASGSNCGQAAPIDSPAVPRQQQRGQQQPQLPATVVLLLDDVAYEVRRQLANKHSLRSPWTPRDLVRFAGAYAALQHRSAGVLQMLDVLSSFCVQRIRSKHLNCVSRPADLAGLLEAYADLQHATVAVPELLAAVGDQVRRGAAQQQEQLDAAAAAAAAVEAAAGAERPAAGAAAAAAAGAAARPLPYSQLPPLPAQAAPQEGFSLAGIGSLVASHIRLGYQPPPLLLQSLAPQIRRQLAGCPASDAAALLQLLAAVPYNPGPAMVGLLLGRVVDEAGAGSQLALAAQQAADALRAAR